MELLNCFYINSYFLNENLLHFAYKSGLNTMEIGFRKINGEINENVYTHDEYFKKNENIFENNINKLLKLPENTFKEELDNILRKTIDEINSRFILYITNSDNIDCSNIYEISPIVYCIKNSLFVLGKEINLYNIKVITDLKNISNLTKLTLGKEKIAKEYRYRNINGYFSFRNRGYNLFELLLIFIGIDGTTGFARRKYKRKSTEYRKIIAILELL